MPNDISFPFDANDSRKPSVNIQAIVSEDLTNQTVNLLPDGAAYTLVDFAESQIWLPVSACDAFARAFNLTYDNKTDLYLVDASTHRRLVQLNPSITFGLGRTYDPGQRVNVVLPYRAFDQQASYPIYENATNYFPIRRAYNDTQYTLGRTFFQEAYIRIDYERGNFSVHQALFPTTNEKQQIVPILSPSGSSSEGIRLESHSLPLSKGAIAGTTVGSIFIAACLLSLLVWFLRKRRKPAKAEEVEEPSMIEVERADEPKLETDGAAFFEKDGKPFVEVEGHAFPELQSQYNGIADDKAWIRRTGVGRAEIFELGDGRRSRSSEHMGLRVEASLQRDSA